MIAPPTEQPTSSALPPRPVRPAGVVLFAVLLGLAGGFCLLLTLGGLVVVLHGMPATPAASASVNTGVMILMTLLYLATAAWAFSTLVGLLRMQPWARTSSMVLAGCFAGVGFLFALGMTGAQSLLSSGTVPLSPSVDLAMLHKVLLFFGLLFLVVAALGVAGVIYFARSSTKQAFLRSTRDASAAKPDAGAMVTEAAPLWPVRPVRVQPQPDPLTDFTVARPLATPVPPPQAGAVAAPEDGNER